MKYNVAIIGGGIIGLGTAYKLLRAKPSLRVLVVEKEKEPAQHQSGHNSGVIHSGIYYTPGSLKARLCREGSAQLLDFCRQNNVAYTLRNKLIIATEENELPRLNALFERGKQNGLSSIKMLSAQEIKTYEPHAEGISAILVPEVGVTNYAEVAKKYVELFKKAGGEVVFNQKVIGINRKEEGFDIKTENGEYSAAVIVNAAGLYADKIAKLGGASLDVRIIPLRGEYFKLAQGKRYLVKNLIYSVPDPALPFLGVHFTPGLEGEVKAGPNAVFAFKREGYNKLDFNLADFFGSISWPGFQKAAIKYFKSGVEGYRSSFSKAAYVRELQKLLPEITENDLIPAGSGVRAQAFGRDGSLINDFLIQENGNQINLLNAPSPAATASLAIADVISGLAIKRL